MNESDVVIIGAGFSGSVCARVLAEAGRRVLLLEEREHIGGNAYDYINDFGVLTHRYGPHIFHTNDEAAFTFLSRFTEWNGYHHKVAARIGGELVPVPFNLISLRQVFDKDSAASLEKKLIERFGRNAKVPILALRESDDRDLLKLADYVYENVFKIYTMKQWGLRPEEIDPNTTARVPVFIGTDCGYFTDKYQGLPTDGYTAMFARMLEHHNIELALNTSARERLHFAADNVYLDGQAFDGELIYTGALDEMFSCCYGHLPYRTLDFVFENIEQDKFQPYGTINYTVSEDYTRVTEFKHLTRQNLDGRTTICKEYSHPYRGGQGEIPYYAIINEENNALYSRYQGLVKEHCPKLHPLGRLAEYRYYNMDETVTRALRLCKKMLGGEL